MLTPLGHAVGVRITTALSAKVGFPVRLARRQHGGGARRGFFPRILGARRALTACDGRRRVEDLGPCLNANATSALSQYFSRGHGGDAHNPSGVAICFVQDMVYKGVSARPKETSLPESKVFSDISLS
ncbi:hypothetical protein F5B22DRAFT_650219 [Xylaria bambusicola]|uniref:uncharacterized protein n=1 Tax=Xylaria bambusicola TaxID=326684 RepID=UPI0020087120|nr:uncharacterized protein F5B22DRAFT_650219 [Xylaria bambusicola]KAI0506902.1 hypothetical protein F5B22DRAFT_650219 [Xylaria bambusicola]